MPLRDDLLTPIAGENPAGANLRYELYDIVREARREEIDAPTGGWDRPRKVADWALVAKETSTALATRTKDLQLAAWLAEAMYRREGFSGLAAALRTMKALLEQFWDGLYPELEDGDAEARAAVLQWLGDGKQPLAAAIRLAPVTNTGLDLYKFRESRQVGYEADATDYDSKQARKKLIDSGKMTAEEFDHAFDATPKAWYKQLAADIQATLDAIDALDGLGNEKFGRDAPGYAQLRSAIEEVQRIVRELLDRKLAADPDPVEVAPLVEEPLDEGNGAAPAASGGAPQTLSAEPTSRDDAAQRIVTAARWLRRTEPTSPTSYLMLRALRWGELRAQAPEPDPRLLAAPTPTSRTQLRMLLLDAKWPELLDAAETVMSSTAGRGWLDLQHYALRACTEMGAEYGTVASAIRSELRALLRELPSLVDLTLMDGLPTASPETRHWLRVEFAGADADEVAIAAEPAEGPAASATSPAAPDGGDRAYARALGEIRAGRPQKAIELLLRELDREKSQRGRFVRQAQLTRIMVESGFEAIARPILDEMLQRMDTHKLEEWEAGPLLAQPLAALYQCLEKSGEDNARKQQLYLRICRLDPVQAMSFGPRS